MKKQYVLSIVGLLALFTVLSVAMISTDTPSSQLSSDKITYNSDVCKSVTRANGEYEDLGCSHNLLTSAGKNAIKDALNGGSSSFSYLALCDASIGCSAPAVGDTVLENELASLGLTRAQGTYASNSGNGNWTISKTFVATGSVSTNKTGLFNASSSGTLLAENAFTVVNLLQDDALTINYTIWVS